MSLASTLDNDLKQAMLSRNKQLADLLRLLKSALKNEEINLKKKELSDEETIKILKREAKKRQDSIIQFTTGQRQDLVAQEQRELELIKKYLPPAMNPADIQKIISEVIAHMDAVSPSQFGVVMGAVMKRIGGEADGTVVSQLVKTAIDK